MKMFDQSDLVTSNLDEKQKKQSLIATVSVIVLFILSAFTFMNFLYCLSDCIGSIVCASADVALRDAIRSVPLILSFFMTLAGLMVAHTFYRNESESKLRVRAKKHARIGIVIGAIIIAYVIIMRFAGTYLSLLEGSPSPLYPLDAVIYAAIFIVLGVIILIYLKKGSYAGASRPSIQTGGKFVRSFFRAIWLMIGLYGFCGFFYSIFIVDFRNGYVPYSLAMMLVSLVAFLTVAVWELFYNAFTAEKRRNITLPLAIVSLAVSVGSAFLYFLALKANLDGPANVGFGILPIAFSASVNFATLLVVATPLIVSVVALVKGIIRLIKK